MAHALYQKIGALFPQPLERAIGTLLVQGGFRSFNARAYLGFSVFFTLSCALLFFFLTPFLLTDPFWHLAVPAAVVLMGASLFYLLLEDAAQARGREIERMLPDALSIIGANIRAGMTLENAVWNAARPEFGPLRDEINAVTSATFGGTPFSESLHGMTQRVRSAIVERAVNLIVEGVALGGSMAPLLSEVAKEVRQTHGLDKEILTATTTYSIFIIFSAVVASPILFSVSVFYSELNEDFGGRMPEGIRIEPGLVQSAGVGGLPGFGNARIQTSIRASDVRIFAAAAIFMTAFFAALILGQVRYGSALRGSQWVPFFVAAALGLFFLTESVLSRVFANLLG